MSEPKEKRRKEDTRRKRSSRSPSPEHRSKHTKAAPHVQVAKTGSGHRENPERHRDRHERRRRSTSRENDNKRRKHEDDGRHRPPHSRDNHRDRDSPPRRDKRRQRRRSGDGEKHQWGKKEPKEEPEQKVAVKPEFGLSGKLAEDTNIYNGVVIKYNEPPEARKPKRRWRLYPFKGDVSLPFIPLHRQSAYLLGRSRLIADIPIDHPSCSKQHAVLQFRLVPYTRNDGTMGRRVRPYVIDLESANGTFVNNKQVEPRRYVELLEQDVLKFGFSTREYVILHEESQGEHLDDDVAGTGEEEEPPSNTTAA
ncbi:smad nuclear-interacting protein 1 [Dermacentor albipictus]|uniref:smad nuclear-interacting protein 1 n=1 Tax=Dermacentor albipictus TaxID=60249 RepID=UPI0031FC09CA